jgi:hypothetical protein
MTDSRLSVTIKKVEYVEDISKSVIISSRIYLKLNLESTIYKTNPLAVGQDNLNKSFSL